MPKSTSQINFLTNSGVKSNVVEVRLVILGRVYTLDRKQPDSV